MDLRARVSISQAISNKVTRERQMNRIAVMGGLGRAQPRPPEPGKPQSGYRPGVPQLPDNDPLKMLAVYLAVRQQGGMK